jgi:hypothetical protein
MSDLRSRVKGRKHERHLAPLMYSEDKTRELAVAS